MSTGENVLIMIAGYLVSLVIASIAAVGIGLASGSAIAGVLVGMVVFILLGIGTYRLTKSPKTTSKTE